MQIYKCQLYLKNIEQLKKFSVNPCVCYGSQVYFFKEEKIEILLNNTNYDLTFCWGKHTKNSMDIKLDFVNDSKQSIDVVIQLFRPISLVVLLDNGKRLLPGYALWFLLSYLLPSDFQTVFRISIGIACSFLYCLYLYLYLKIRNVNLFNYIIKNSEANN